MSHHGNDGRFANWMSSGLVATVAWVLVLIIYCTFRAFKIEDPFIGQAFLLLTGLWVGNLTLAQGKKTAKTEAKADAAHAEGIKTEKRVDRLETEVVKGARRADASEERERGWSQHQDHTSEDDE